MMVDSGKSSSGVLQLGEAIGSCGTLSIPYLAVDVTKPQHHCDSMQASVKSLSVTTFYHTTAIAVLIFLHQLAMGVSSDLKTWAM